MPHPDNYISNVPAVENVTPTEIQNELPDELMADEMQDIISHKPHWLIRYGVSIIALLVLCLTVFSWFVHYPDIVKAPLTIIAVHAPKKVIAKSEGKLQQLLIKNGDVVTELQPLAYLQSTGAHEEVMVLRQWITALEKALAGNSFEALNTMPMPSHASLGELQPFYYTFQSVYQETLQTLHHGFYQQKMEALKKDMLYLEEQDQILNKQKKLILEDYALQENDFKAREHLAKEKVIAPLEFGQDKSKMISKAAAIEQMETLMLNQKVNKHNKQKEIMELQKLITDNQSKFMASLLSFKNQVDEWINRYIVLSPENGRLLFISPLQQNQHVALTQELFYIEPDNSTFYGEIIANQTGFGKISPGQTVMVRLESFPSTEFGYLQGKIVYISPSPVKDNNFIIQVALPEGMRTNYNKILPYRNNLKAQAEIITEDRRLPEKLFSNLREAIKR